MKRSRSGERPLGLRPRNRRYVEVFVLACIAALCISELFLFQRVEGYGADSSIYIQLAENLVHKGSYEFNGKPHALYPPGFPMILALANLVTGGSYTVFVRLMALFGALSLLVGFYLLRQEQGRGLAVVVCLLLATSPYFFAMTTRTVGSDLPFFFVSALALLTVKWLETELRPWCRKFLVVVLFGAVVAAVGIRSAGVALPAGFFLACVLRPSCTAGLHRAILPAMVAGLLVLVAWVGWSKQRSQPDYASETSTYMDQAMLKDPHQPDKGPASVADLIARAAVNARAQAAHFSELVLRAPWINQAWYSPAVLVPLVVIMAGWAVSFWSFGSPWLAGYFAVYMAVYLLWPFDEGPRFLLPAFLLAFLYFYRGLEFTVRQMQRVPGLAALAALVSAALSGYVFFFVRAPGLQIKDSAVAWLCAAVALAAVWLGVPGKVISRWTVGVAPRAAGSLGLGLLMAIGLYGQARMGHANLRPDPTTYLHHAAWSSAQWLRSQAAPRVVVMAQQAAIIHRLTGLRTVRFPATANVELIRGTLRKHGVQYLVVNDPVQHEYLLPGELERYQLLSARYPGLAQLAHRGPGCRIFRIQGD